MSKINIKVTDTSYFYSTLEYDVEVPDYCSVLEVRRFLEQNGIHEQNITKIAISIKNKMAHVSIEFCKIDLLKLGAMDEELQIRKVLECMGYNENDIKSIKYDFIDLEWNVHIHDINYDFTPDESLCERGYRMSKNKILDSVLDFKCYIHFV